MPRKEIYWKHRERIRKEARRYYKKNKEKLKENRKKYYQNNKDKQKDYDKKMYEIRRIRAWSSHRKDEIFKLKGNKCKICETKENLQIHHKKYEKSFECIEVLCHQCHVQVHRDLR